MSRHSIRTNPIIEKLKGDKETIISKCFQNPHTEKKHTCSRVLEDDTCSAYAYPQAKWRSGDCPLADSELRQLVIEEPKKKHRVGQQKQKKRR